MEGARFSTIYIGALSGTGTVDIGLDNMDVRDSVGSGQTFDFATSDASDASTLTLEAGALPLFSGLVTGFGSAVSDQIVVNGGWQYQGFAANSSGTGGSLMFTNGVVEASVSLVGSYDPKKLNALYNSELGQTTIFYSGLT